MNIVMIIHGYAPRIGGAERQLGSLAPILQSLGVKVSVLTRYHPGSKSFEVIDGVDVYRLPTPGPKAFASVFFTLAAIIKIANLKPDIIHAHELISPATTALIANYLYKIPFVVTPHSSGPLGDVKRMRHKLFGDLRLSLICRRVSYFFVISEEIDQELASIGVENNKRVNVSNGVDTNHFIKISLDKKNELREKFGVPLDSTVVIFIGRLIKLKRIDDLLKVMHRIQKKHPSAILAIVGSGPLLSELNLLNDEVVIYYGKQDDVAPFLQVSDIFVLPSETEGLPLSLLESMSCEVASIASNVGGIPEVIDHKVNGLLFVPKNLDSLEEAILSLIKDQQMRQIIGSKGRQKILEKYTIQKMADKLINKYRSILKNSEGL